MFLWGKDRVRRLGPVRLVSVLLGVPYLFNHKQRLDRPASSNEVHLVLLPGGELAPLPGVAGWSSTLLF